MAQDTTNHKVLALSPESEGGFDKRGLVLMHCNILKCSNLMFAQN